MKPNSYASRIELTLWTLFLAIVNAPLWFDVDLSSLFLFPDLAVSQPWRWVTHPFAHVSPYHFLIDTSVALTLFAALPGTPLRRMLLFAGCAIGSTLGALAGPHDLNQLGFGGLSGAAHGLSVFLALSVATKSGNDATRSVRSLAAAMAGIVCMKAFFEVLTGGVFFASWHAGSVGTPIVACHLGGALAGALLAGIATPRSLAIEKETLPREVLRTS